MTGQPQAWRTGLIGLLIVAALIGAVWYGGKQDRSARTIQPSSTPSEQQAGENQAPPQRNMGLKKGDSAPVFALQTLDGQTMDLAKRNGKPALINFWATWCPPCREEMPVLQSMYKRYGKHVDFFMVNLTTEETNVERVSQFLQQHKLTFPVLKDETGEVAETYSILAIPTTYIVDANGVIVWSKTGAVTKKEVTDVLDSLIKPEG
ncbi:redoxin family protein [Polycladomyces subterraneus]|uniref:Redoxin family protein n=1 Tax=Polycladomyces subterraneus TaxID=1016997 RepID=A0ABT8IQ75_9BACL|nr:redoxin domain-containing protein [Polycladomyces subterraneus]MDN4594938.1 redoxin family protein [Polycladomyces subterraneus]